MKLGATLARSHRFWWGLGAVALGALVLRVWYATTVPSWDGGDSGYYHLQANLIADGHWFVHPYVFLYRGQYVPSAEHPPLWSLVLSVSSILGGRSMEAHRIVGCLVGTSTVVMIGLTGRRLLGVGTGLACAAIAAVYPNLWISDGLVETSSLFVLLIALVILLSYRWLDEPTLVRALALGFVVGLAALTRGEAILLVPILGTPMLIRSVLPRTDRLAAVGALGLVSLVVVAPWLAFNLTRFEQPFWVATGGAISVGAANCGATYSGPEVGKWSPRCWWDPAKETAELATNSAVDESVLSRKVGTAGLRYASDHLTDVPRVALFRLGRAWGLYRPDQNLAIETILDGRDIDISRVGQFMYCVLVALGIGGLVRIRHRGRPIFPLLAMFVLVCITTAATFGSIRLRMPAEASLILLSGALVGQLLEPAPRAAAEIINYDL